MALPPLLTTGFTGEIRYRLTDRDRLLWDGAEYSWVSSNDAGHVLRAPGIPTDRPVDHASFREHLQSGAIRYQRDYWSSAAVLRRDRGIANYEDLTQEQRETIMHRLRWVEAFERLYVSGRVTKAPDGYRTAVRLIADMMAAEAEDQNVGIDGRPLGGDRPAVGRTAPSWSQLGRWVRAYAKADRDALALLHRNDRSGNRKARLDAVVRRLIERTAARYCMPNRPTVKLLHDRLARTIRRHNRMFASGLKVPSVRAVERAVAQIDDFEKMAGRHGIDHARRYFAAVFPAPIVSAPLERVEMDEWTVSLQVLLERAHVFETLTPKQRRKVTRVRCTLTAAIDVATRCIVGISLTNQSPASATSLSALRQIMEDKEPIRRAVGARTPWPCSGRPETVVTDKGSAFKAVEFRWALERLGIQPGRPPAGTPNFRGTIERFFGFLETGFAARFDGRTFSGIAEKGDYDAELNATLTILELERALIRYICDVYHRTPRGVLGGLSPAQAWNRLISGGGNILPPPERDELCRAFGTRFTRPVRGHGVRILGCNYNHEDLIEAWEIDAGLKVQVYVDEFDLGQVSVRVREGHWIEAIAEDRRFHGLSFDRLTDSEETLLAQGLPAFVGVEDGALNVEIMDEACRDIDRIGARSRRRAGIFDPQVHAERLRRAKQQVGKAFRYDAQRRAVRPHPADAVPIVPGAADPFEGGPIRRAPEIEEAPRSFDPFAGVEEIEAPPLDGTDMPIDAWGDDGLPDTKAAEPSDETPEPEQAEMAGANAAADVATPENAAENVDRRAAADRPQRNRFLS